jgi:hypothetical protein
LSENSTMLPKRKHTLLPTLTVLFLIAYGLMTMLIVEQGNTIESQRLLIKQLFSDSAELSAMKAHEARKHHAAPARPKNFVEHPAQPKARPKQREPRVDAPQAPVDPQRSVISL